MIHKTFPGLTFGPPVRQLRIQSSRREAVEVRGSNARVSRLSGGRHYPEAEAVVWRNRRTTKGLIAASKRIEFQDMVQSLLSDSQ